MICDHMPGSFKILSISDIPIPFIYSPHVRQLFSDVSLVICCGDLPYAYSEYVLNRLGKPLFFVHGNHDPPFENSNSGRRIGPNGGLDLHRRVIAHQGILLAGVEGSHRYRPGGFQYSQAEMWYHALSLVPGLLYNRMLYGRFLDILVTHAPPRGIHDQDDQAHQGIAAFRWLDRVFQPGFHFHGHVHIYRPDATTQTMLGRTHVINTYGFRVTVMKDTE